MNDLDIDISYYSWIFVIIRQLPRKSDLRQVIRSTNNFVILLFKLGIVWIQDHDGF